MELLLYILIPTTCIVAALTLHTEDEYFNYIINRDANTITILFERVKRFRSTSSHEIQFNYDIYFDWVQRNMLNNYETTIYDPISNTKTTIVNMVGMHEYQYKLLDKSIKSHIKLFINEYKKSKL